VTPQKLDETVIHPQHRKPSRISANDSLNANFARARFRIEAERKALLGDNVGLGVCSAFTKSRNYTLFAAQIV
jgi:hypothetical protein